MIYYSVYSSLFLMVFVFEYFLYFDALVPNFKILMRVPLFIQYVHK